MEIENIEKQLTEFCQSFIRVIQEQASEASKSSEELHRPTPSRAVMSLKRDVVSRVTKAVDTETEYRKQLNAKAAEYNVPQLPEGSICIPDVAIYFAGHRKSNQVTAR